MLESLVKKCLLPQLIGSALVASQYSPPPAVVAVAPADPYASCVATAQRLGLRRANEMYSLDTLEERLGVGRNCCFRNMDGTANNLELTDRGSAGMTQQRIVPTGKYPTISSTGVESVSGNQMPTPRAVSSLVLKEVGNQFNPFLSSFAWVWLQFIDHDITLVHDNPASCTTLTVEVGDRCIPGGANIRFCDSEVASNGDPINDITSFIDGSMVYGNSAALANELRGGGPGELRVSPSVNGDLLPPASGGPFPEFLAGDERVNENPGLTALHTLFVREHNYLVKQAIANAQVNGVDMDDDDALYEFAREQNVAQIQAITFNEILPLLLGDVPAYTGYKPDVDPATAVEFGILYRIGHSMVNDGFIRLDENGGASPEGPLPLRDSFFNPSHLWRFGLESLLRGLVATPSREVDTFIIDGLRNFLFGPPVDGVSALDLGSINIQRGRSAGVPLYNDLREGLGLRRRYSMQDVSSDQATVARLVSAYGDNVDAVDAWVGALAEDHVSSSVATGELTSTLLKTQFAKYRDGDRFWYENSDLFSAEFTAQVRSTTLADIIKRNTDIGSSAWDVQSFNGNVFFRTRAACAADAGCGSDVNEVCLAEPEIAALPVTPSVYSRPA